MNDLSALQKNIEDIRAEIPDSVEILAAVKTRNIETVKAAFDAGIRKFGHNYVQEAEAMVHGVDLNAEWHMIGHLQRNKAKQAVSLFDMIETVDSLRLAKELEKRCAQIEKTMPVLVEVNSGREENKTGVLPENAASLAEFLNSCRYLKLEGLMTMGPLMGDPELSRPYFQKTRQIFREISDMRLEKVAMKTLSMGVSNSYRIAVEEGATQVRLGTILFGPRQP